MRIDRFQEFACQTYQQDPQVISAAPYSDGPEGRKRPYGIRVQLRTGTTVRHAITRVPVEGEDLAKPETPVEGQPPTPVDDRPAPAGARDRDTARYLAAVLAAAGHPEISRAYAYGEANQHPGLGVEFHSGARIHMLLV